MTCKEKAAPWLGSGRSLDSQQRVSLSGTEHFPNISQPMRFPLAVGFFFRPESRIKGRNTSLEVELTKQGLVCPRKHNKINGMAGNHRATAASK